MIESILLGIIGSLIASILFLSFISYFRPKLLISENISKGEYDGNIIYSIKVVNCGNREAINIKAELQLIGTRVVSGGRGRKIYDVELLKSDSLILNPYKNDKSHNYSFEFSTKVNIEEEWGKREETSLIFRLIAQDSLTSFYKVFEQEYYLFNKSIIPGRFDIGKSMQIHN